MDTFDTSEEIMSEIDIEATEVDFGENFEFGVNDQEHENNNEQETGIGGENGEKSIEDEKLEEKEETLSQFISANRGGSEEFKLEYEGTFVLSTLSEEQKTAQADLLTTLTANPEQSMMLPDHVEGKTTFFTAARMDNEGNLKYEIRSYTEKEEEEEEKPTDKVEGVKVEEATLDLELSIDIDKQEEVDKETILSQSLLTEAEVTSEQEIEKVEEIVQSEEGTFIVSESSQIDVEPITVQEEGIVDNVVSHEQFFNIDTILNGEQVVVENFTAEIVEERTIEDVQKVLTLEERIIELLRDEDEPIEVVSEQAQTSEVENTQQEQIIVETNRTTEINTTTETVAEAEITLPPTYTEINELIVNEIPNTTAERSAISNEQVGQIVVDIEDVQNRAEIHEAVQASYIENIQEQNTELVEQIFNAEKVGVNIVEERPEEVVLVNEQESKVSSTIEQIITKEVNTDIKVEGLEHATIEQIHIEKIDIVNEINQDKENIITKTEEGVLNVSTIPLNTTETKFEQATSEKIVEVTEDKDITSQQVEISKPIVSETTAVLKETSINSNQEVEPVVVNMSETTEISSIVEEIKAEEVVEKVQSSDVAVEAVVTMPQEISKAETILSEVPVAEGKEVKSESNVAQEVVVNNIQAQDIVKVETVSYVADNNKTETQNVRSINIAEKADQHIESPFVVKGEEKVVAETKGREINPKTEKTDNAKPEKITTERIITERRIQDRKEKPEKVTLNNDKDTKIANTRESKTVAKEARPEKVQVLNTKSEKEAKGNVLPFKTRESRSNPKDVEIKSTKPIAEKTTREAIVLKFNGNTVNNTIRSEAQRSLEKPREEKRITEEDLKAKPLSGHEILLQILGISQNAMESRNAEPTNSRSVPNINQEEQETKSTKSIPSIYQQRNLNGITLKIAA